MDDIGRAGAGRRGREGIDSGRRLPAAKPRQELDAAPLGDAPLDGDDKPIGRQLSPLGNAPLDGRQASRPISVAPHGKAHDRAPGPYDRSQSAQPRSLHSYESVQEPAEPARAEIVADQPPAARRRTWTRAPETSDFGSIRNDARDARPTRPPCRRRIDPSGIDAGFTCTSTRTEHTTAGNANRAQLRAARMVSARFTTSTADPSTQKHGIVTT